MINRHLQILIDKRKGLEITNLKAKINFEDLCNRLNKLLISNKVSLEECEVNEDSVKVKVKKVLSENFYNNLFKLGLNLREITAISRAL